MDDILQVVTGLSSPGFLHSEIDIQLFVRFLRIFKSEILIQNFLIQDFFKISRPIVNENGISICQNLSLGVDNQKRIKF